MVSASAVLGSVFFCAHVKCLENFPISIFFFILKSMIYKGCVGHFTFFKNAFFISLSNAALIRENCNLKDSSLKNTVYKVWS